MKNVKARPSDLLADVVVIDDTGKAFFVPMYDFIIAEEVRHIEIQAPQESELPRIDIYYLPTETQIHAWASTEEYMNQIKEQICLQFNNFAGSFKRAFFESKKHGLIKEFVCKLLN